MRVFQDASIRNKQVLIIMLITSVALLLACAAFVTFETITFRKEMAQNLSTLGKIIGNNTAAAVDFNDAPSAEETLSGLKAQPNVVGACVFSRNGTVFARYERPGGAVPFTPLPTPKGAGYSFGKNSLIVFEPITSKGDTIGVVYLESDMHTLHSVLAQFAAITLIVALLTLLVAFLMSARLQRLISDPILELVRTARAVTAEKDYSIRVKKRSADEIGGLIDGFNEMLSQIQVRDLALETSRDHLEKRVEERTRELENLHKQLVESSRLAGMAEIATNVLHNVGNVLNSVNISTDLIKNSIEKSKASSLVRVVALLQEHAHDLGGFLTQDSSGKHVPAILARLSEHLLAEQSKNVSELDSLRRNIEHIKEIVAMQQNYATVGGLKEMIDLVSLVEDSLRLNEGAFKRHGVEVVREFTTVLPMNVEKHKVLQILVNLVRNAKYACDDSLRSDRRMTVRVANGDGRVKISVIDNGVGIPPENLTRIFNYGFTTRKDGHGFGLHSSALAAKEMGGSLAVRSGGLGEGADFTLELPCPKQENLHV